MRHTEGTTTKNSAFRYTLLKPMLFLSLVLQFSAAWLMALFANWVGLIRWRRAVAAHWTERARLLFPVRVTAVLNMFLIPGITIHFALFPEVARWWVSGAVASFLGAVLGCYYLDHEAFPQLHIKEWLLQVIVGWGIRFFVFLPAIAAGLLMPVNLGPTALVITAAYVAVHFAIQCGLLVRCLCLTKILKPPSVRLKGIVNDVAARSGVPVRATWQFGGIMATAFAFPFSGELAFSDRLLAICNDDEISAVCAHEIAHLGEPNVVVAGRLIGSLYLLPFIFITPLLNRLAAAGLIFPFLGMLSIYLPFLGMFAIRGFAVWLTRRMEKRADRIASTTTTTSEGAYAGALEKMYRENQIPAVNAGRQSHPDLYDRMLGAGVKPDYPRPERPARITLVGWLYISACIAATVAGFHK